MKHPFFQLILLISMGLFLSDAIAQVKPRPGRQVAGRFSTTIQLDYLLYLPKSYDASSTKKWPLILFLHGAGERGENVEFVKLWGPPNLVEQKDFPFIVLAPLCPGDQWWTDLILPVKKLLDEIILNYRVDLSRIYLTGLSMGGYGTFAMMQNYPQYFAAYAPITGGGNPMAVSRYANVPAWVFSGDQDEVVPLYNSQTMVDSLRAHGADIKLTIHKGLGHWLAWEPAYRDSALFDWFLSKQKKYR